MELRIVSENLRAEARELLATAGQARLKHLAKKPTGSPQAVHSLSTGLLPKG